MAGTWYDGPYRAGSDLQTEPPRRRERFPRNYSWDARYEFSLPEQSPDAGGERRQKGPYEEKGYRENGSDYEGSYDEGYDGGYDEGYDEGYDGGYEKHHQEEEGEEGEEDEEEDNDERRRRRRRRRCRRCLCISLLILAGLMTLMGVLVLCLYFVFQPESPVVSLKTASMASFSLTNHTMRRADNKTTVQYKLDAVMDVEVQVHNRNKVAVRFDALNASIGYLTTKLGYARVPPFTAAAHATGAVKVKLQLKKRELGELGPAMATDVRKAYVSFWVEGRVGGRLKILGLTAPSKYGELKCKVVVNPLTLKVMNKGCNH